MYMWYVRGVTLKVIYSLRSRSGKKTTLSGAQGGFRIPGWKLENKALAGKGSVTFPPPRFHCDHHSNDARGASGEERM